MCNQQHPFSGIISLSNKMKLQHLLLHYRFHANDLLQKMSINRTLQGVQDQNF